ncbi:hypothetical protein AKJ16_DCAP26285, partial [Drosera capensis]
PLTIYQCSLLLIANLLFPFTSLSLSLSSPIDSPIHQNSSISAAHSPPPITIPPSIGSHQRSDGLGFD